MDKPSIYERIMYHNKRKTQSKFSEGYILSAEKRDPSMRKRIIQMDEDFHRSLQKHNKKNPHSALNKGYKAFLEDLKKEI